ncbi:MAG: Sec-independent protein translocase protein TatA [Candidatus Collierbacteria bacterium GW2011_GWC1_45_47]|uniref:Sec-independent protein translocase protein TatA n=4 Tax=Candidatus Collieribacteriota TaxID=1752725 RepID=A0A0G1HEY7_9BACT|nr:MAG: Sec-independent protein translocase protein TatA [Candidatus Collierbacteria bacterium GW2011_GWA1_44_12]KKT37769.1 MAG: Sec-independent protein translocase protein TatA [Candidatus Collierbacteria bacterium GW2011_GWF1_44_12]KKT45901.1 MAG: Sec-independent protein translocase protein TatA [Candidatus Collierbacteria bacterium GW2011_GWF2_44_15]KKU08810.1 MAG: Sec-independent protein translocase protein TatA [Candidatus Collierbacteria bacterium GW2011_GWC1_45_47]KKU27456.1 MAG: Sec-ind
MLNLFKNIGWVEIAIIAVVLIVLFGGRLLPKIGKSVGESGKELKDATKELKDAVKE